LAHNKGAGFEFFCLGGGHFADAQAAVAHQEQRRQSDPRLGVFWLLGFCGQHGHHPLIEVRGEGAFNLYGVQLLIDLRVTDRCPRVAAQVAHLVQPAHGRAQDLHRLLLAFWGEGACKGFPLRGEAATPGTTKLRGGGFKECLVVLALVDQDG